MRISHNQCKFYRAELSPIHQDKGNTQEHRGGDARFPKWRDWQPFHVELFPNADCTVRVGSASFVSM